MPLNQCMSQTVKIIQSILLTKKSQDSWKQCHYTTEVWQHFSRNIPILWRAVGGTTLTLQGPSGQPIGWSGRQAVWTVALHHRQRQSCSLKHRNTLMQHCYFLPLVIKHHVNQFTVQTDNYRGLFYCSLIFHPVVFYIKLSVKLYCHVSECDYRWV
jgi:hypothetical protein